MILSEAWGPTKLACRRCSPWSTGASSRWRSPPRPSSRSFKSSARAWSTRRRVLDSTNYGRRACAYSGSLRRAGRASTKFNTCRGNLRVLSNKEKRQTYDQFGNRAFGACLADNVAIKFGYDFTRGKVFHQVSRTEAGLGPMWNRACEIAEP